MTLINMICWKNQGKFVYTNIHLKYLLGTSFMILLDFIRWIPLHIKNVFTLVLQSALVYERTSPENNSSKDNLPLLNAGTCCMYVMMADIKD